MKEMKSFRLDTDARYYLEKFSKEDGKSQSAIIEESLYVLRQLRYMKDRYPDLTVSVESLMGILGI